MAKGWRGSGRDNIPGGVNLASGTGGVKRVGVGFGDGTAMTSGWWVFKLASLQSYKAKNGNVATI